MRRRKISRFIQSVEELPELFTEFDVGQRAVEDSLKVYDKESITWQLTCGMELEC